MTLRTAVLLLAALGGPSLGVAQGGEPLPIAEAGLFRVGERLKYEVRWGFVTLGTAEMSVVGIDTIRGTPAAHIQFRIIGGTYFFRMDDRMDSWVALSDTSSRRFTQDNNENNKERHAWYDIFPDSGYYREKGVDSLKPKPTVPHPLDDAAFFYYVRTMRLDSMKKYEIPRYFRPDRNPVILDVRTKDTIDVPAGKFPSIVLQPIIKGQGILKEAAEAKMWLTDDDRHLMVQLKSKFRLVGYLTMRLISVENRSAP